MIGRLTGIVVDQDLDGIIVIDVSGVGYEVIAPVGTVGRAEAIAGEGRPVTLYVHTHVREDTFSLFGFATLEDRLAFRTLIAVSNVGPRTAVGILSHLSAADLATAIRSKNTQALVAAPGVGKRTAERLMLELRDKLDFLVAQAPAGAAVRPATRHGAVVAQVVEALARMGFKPAEAERAVASLGPEAEEGPVERVLRLALTAIRQ
jgi:Holliday junction DNA helicase RuvA